MKTRLALWGTDGEGSKVLLAIALRAEDSMVDVWAFPVEVATESFYKRLINEWRFGREVPFPDMFAQYESPFTTGSEILPDGLKADRDDLLLQAQTEWQFVILSARALQSYKGEIEFLKEKIERLNTFDKQTWEELKGFWEKVQGQITGRVLYREHGFQLREIVNALFNHMKSLRRSMDVEFKAVSKENLEQFMAKITGIEERLAQDHGLHPIFEELKQIERQFRDTRFIREDRRKVLKRLDRAFKVAKEKRFGPDAKKSQSPASRVARRYEGLIRAMQKMENSIGHDERDIEIEERRIAESGGQLEAQIRQAKLAMIKERIRSKQEKLADMEKTKTELEQRIVREQAREEERRKREEIRKVEVEVKDKITREIRESAGNRDLDAERLKKAAGEISESTRRKRGRGKQESPQRTRPEKKHASGAVAGLVTKKILGTIDTEEE